ncbi:cytochrome b561 domain-containing protein 2-like [Bombyx mandarina]|uniref:ascorbate ferrireductase (transmembrane) n=1 Tax=Bombyx mandarina TaxID=7092 RepID=A0A6J2K7Q7_BOMMA|nr:cytochrome b561 domain-containing protein 2-like [Bombyx mandarina]
MEGLEQEHSINTEENMSTADRNSESSRLVTSNASTKPSYLNLCSNTCSVIFLCIISYCSFHKGVTLFSFHPILMSLGWVIIMTSAINAITPGDFATEWMPIRLRSARHWLLQVVGFIFITAGFFVILINKIINGKDHFTSLHAKFGLSSLILMLVTMMGGLGALYSLKLKNYLAPIYTKLLHASIGLLTFVLGVITILLGLFTRWWSFGDPIRYTNFTLVLAIMLLTILRPSLKIYFRLKERIENTN